MRGVVTLDACLTHQPMVSWYSDGFRLELFTTVLTSADDRLTVAYRFWDLSQDTWRARPVFTGAHWHPSVLHAVDGVESVRGLLGFLSLRPGDVEADYFTSYTPRQLHWREVRAEDLAWWASEPDQTGEPALVLDHDSVALPLGRIRYAVVPHDGLGPWNTPELPATRRHSRGGHLSARRETLFRSWLAASGNDHPRASGRKGVGADLPGRRLGRHRLRRPAVAPGMLRAPRWRRAGGVLMVTSDRTRLVPESSVTFDQITFTARRSTGVNRWQVFADHHFTPVGYLETRRDPGGSRERILVFDSGNQPLGPAATCAHALLRLHATVSDTGGDPSCGTART